MISLVPPAGFHERVPWCILASSSEGICLVEAASGQIVWNNLAFSQACGIANTLVGASIRSYFPCWPKIESCVSQSGTAWNFRAISLEKWHCVYAQRITTQQSTALIDALTGLADRAYFDERLRKAWEQFRTTNGLPFALIFIDLDNFKRINDAWGHLMGDEALRQVSERLKSALREVDLLARYGGDEFVALLPGFRNPNSLPQVVRRLYDSLLEPIRLETMSVAISASIGGACSAGGYSTPEELLFAADQAMYAAKRLR